MIGVCDAPMYLEPKDLHPWPGNPRVLTDGKRRRLRDRITTLGIYRPLVIWRSPRGSRWYVVGGNQRSQVVKDLVETGWTFLPGKGVPCVPFTGSRGLAERLALRDNRYDGEWDVDILSTWSEDPDLDISPGDLTGIHEILENLAARPLEAKAKSLGETMEFKFTLPIGDYEEVQGIIKDLGLEPSKAVYLALVSWEEGQDDAT